jgi:hypothetical protein
MPVASMSMRLRIGGIQILVSPGTCTARSSSSTSFSGVMPARHCSRGLNWMVVSNISSGAGSVAVSARPALPKTRATSGTVLIMRSVCCSSSLAFCADSPGRAWACTAGRLHPAAGRNSPPSLLIGQSADSNTSSGQRQCQPGPASTASSTGRYQPDQPAIQRIAAVSAGNLPRIQ